VDHEGRLSVRVGGRTVEQAAQAQADLPPGDDREIVLLPGEPRVKGERDGRRGVPARLAVVTPAATWPAAGPSKMAAGAGPGSWSSGTVRSGYVFTGPAEARALASRADDCRACGSGRRWPPSITP